MLNKLILTNFRRHTSLTVDFTSGLNVVRGKNEAGKSSFLEAWLYCLFGSRALKQPLGDVVTYGEKETSLKVQAFHHVDGRDLRFVRSKGGAEVYVDGSNEPFVTGQTDVTKFAVEMLGADLDTVRNLMMANQGSIRGALEKGPVEAAKMIEDLADFTLFDTLIEQAGKQLALGSDSSLRERIERTEKALEESTISLVADDRIEKLQDTVSDKEVEVGYAERFLQEKAEPDLAEASAKVASAKRDRSDYDRLTNAVTAAAAKVERTKLGVASRATQVEYKYSVEAGIADVNQQLEQANAMQAALHSWSVFNNLPKLEDEWEGDRASLDAEIAKVMESVDTDSAKLADLQGKLAQTRASIISDTICPTCRRPLEDHDSIEQANQHARENITKLETDIASTQADLKDNRGMLILLQQVARAGDQVQAAVSASEHITTTGSYVPARTVWSGPKIDTSAPTVADLTKKAKGLAADLENIRRAEAEHAQLAQALVEFESELKTAQADLLNATEPQDLNVLIEAEKEADNKVANARQKVRTLHKEISEIRVEIARIEMQHEQASKAREQLEADLKKQKEDLENLAFNNALVKKIRASRPAVSDKLWTMVLGAVSSMFSQMRGQRTTISKGKDGFRADGESVTGLSGSTLDALGLAIRVCLIRTFVPHCPFLFLDEPFAAADDERSAAMLGFVQACGFQQSLIITHEDISEGVADNLIFLG